MTGDHGFSYKHCAERFKVSLLRERSYLGEVRESVRVRFRLKVLRHEFGTRVHGIDDALERFFVDAPVGRFRRSGACQLEELLKRLRARGNSKSQQRHTRQQNVTHVVPL